MNDEFERKIKESTPANRPDDYLILQGMQNTYQDKTALIILGGNSGKEWRDVQSIFEPDILIGANGTIVEIDNLDFWVMTENIHGVYKRAAFQKCEKSKRIMKWTEITTPKHRMVHHISAPRCRNKTDLIKINRWGFELDNPPPSFNVREYGLGLLSGDLMNRPEIITSLRTGTVGLQCLHLASLLGCRRIITVGYDLCFKDESHHWYKDDVRYEANPYWGDNMFTTYKGLPTLWFWFDTAKYLERFNKLLYREGIDWYDMSSGLLQAMGIK